MRLIDADFLENEGWSLHRTYQKDKATMVYEVKAISEINTAQPRTGRWIPQDYNKKHGNVSTCMYFCPVCSECGYSGDFNMNYCPNCGAKMEETE